jgi:exopolyphosphatase/guanosine-5'-triphosphate,3'-diphosphate pyrophosphatase
VTEAGMREGAFYEELLGGDEPPLLADVRTASVHNLAAQYQADTAHTTHVARLALDVWEALAAAGVHPATTRSASCCGPPRCCTTSARRSTTTTTTSTRAT